MKAALFRRSKSEPTPDHQTTDPTSAAARGQGVKGRPTPTRKEAEAAARERAKAQRTGKQAASRTRAQRAEEGRRMREAMKTGDDRYLPARDRGPVRRFVRDFVDSRFAFLELMVPLLLLTLILGYSGVPTLVNIGNSLTTGILLLAVIDILLMRFRLTRELKRRFPEESTKGMLFYAIMRSLQMKFMRMPKSQVKIGQRLPETYR